MRQRIVRGSLYGLWFLLCLVFFLVKGFPAQVLVERLAIETHKATGMKLSVADADTLFPNGIALSGVRLTSPEEGENPLSLSAERVSVRVSLLSLLGSTRRLSANAEMFSGRLQGELAWSPEGVSVSGKLSALDLERLPFWSDWLGLKLGGKLTGSFQLAVNPKNAAEAGGEISLQLEQGKLGDGQVQVPGWGPLTIPWISLGKTELALAIAKGKADIKTFKVASDDVEASADGYFLLQQRLSQASARCKARFKITDDFLKRNPKFDILTQRLAEARGQDGFYGYSVFGPIGKPQFKPLR